jgi:competence protein ComEC
MRDRDLLVGALAVWLAAMLAMPLPRAVGVLALAVALVTRRPVLVLVALAVLASGLSADARRGLRTAPVGELRAMVELVGDPSPVPGGTRVDVRVHRKRLEATAYGPASGRLARLASGDRVEVTGSVVARPAHASWLDVRHVSGRLRVATVGTTARASPPMRFANAVRRVLARGATPLPRRQRPLYTGFVFGDDRGQYARTVDDFRAAGLGHLLAVSGQNIAFVLAAARPLLTRLAHRYRFAGLVLLLALFVLVTRAEPSVLRAAVMAGIAALAVAAGRTVASRRVLALTVIVLVLVDPLLVRSLGFQLSVLACVGILELAPRIRPRVRGPAWVAEPVAITLGAQLAVLPLAVATFGGVPVAALPANLLAVPASGPIMVWGLTGGAVAGAIGGPTAAALQFPVRLLIAWIELVSAVAGKLPLAELRGPHLVAMGAVGVAAVLAQRADRRVAARAARCALVALVLVPAAGLRNPDAMGDRIAPGAQLWARPGATVLVVEGRADPVAVLAGLRRAGVRRVDLLVLGTGASSARAVAVAVTDRYDVDQMGGPTNHAVRGAVVVPAGTVAVVGPFTVRVDADSPRLDVRVDAPP